MSKYGRSIKTFLANGTPAGLRYVEIANWSGQSIACPRSRFSDLGKWDESKRPGVYFLFNSFCDNSELAYIGESEDVYKRLTDHDRKKEFWQEVIIFTSKDENLTKGHVKYLEARLIEITKDSERYQLTNTNTPSKSSLPRADVAAMEEFIDNVRVVLGSLGHKILEPLNSSTIQVAKDSKERSLLDYEFNFSVYNISAMGRVVDDGFVLLKGSMIAHKSSSKMPERSLQFKQKLIASQLLESKGDHYILLKDQLMGSSSAAANLVAGNSRSGPQGWKNSAGILLKDLEAQIFASV